MESDISFTGHNDKKDAPKAGDGSFYICIYIHSISPIKKMPLKQGTEVILARCVSVQPCPIKKMPLKQGTEVRMASSTTRSQRSNKKDAPKAGDGNGSNLTKLAFVL